MPSNVERRVVHKRKASSINRSFAAPFSPRILFSDSANPVLAITAPPVVATCAHPFSDEDHRLVRVAFR